MDLESGKQEELKRPAKVGVLEGLRVISAIVVLFHHIGSLDRDLWNGQTLEEIQYGLKLKDLYYEDMYGKGRRLYAETTNARSSENFFVELFYYIINVGPGHVAVEVFLILAGFVSAHSVYSKMGNGCDKLVNEEEKEFQSRLGAGFVQRYQKSLLKRFWRLSLPVVPVQLLHYFLWRNKLAYGQYLWFPSAAFVEHEMFVGARSVWSSVLSGSLWVLEALFLAPFLSLGVQLPVQNLRPVSRVVWYVLCMLYFAGDFTAHRSSYLGIVMGVAMADLYNHMYLETIGSVQATLQAIFALVLLSFTWLPGPFYSSSMSMVMSATGAVYLVLYGPRWLSFLLDNKLMLFASKFAYELYIWHLVILSAFAVNVYPVASKVVLYLSAYSACFVAAVLAYYFIEVPANIFTDRFTDWMLAPPDGHSNPRSSAPNPAAVQQASSSNQGTPDI